MPPTPQRRHVVAYNGTDRPLTDRRGRLLPPGEFSPVRATDPVLKLDGVAEVPQPDRKTPPEQVADGYQRALAAALELDKLDPDDEPLADATAGAPAAANPDAEDVQP